MPVSKIASDEFVEVAKALKAVAKREGKLKDLAETVRDEKRDIVRTKLAYTMHAIRTLDKREFTLLKKHQVDDSKFSQNQVDKYSA